MNITPLEIRQKVFEKNFRGYDKDEVTAFLNSLSIEWEKLNDQNKELKYRLEASEKEVQKLREVENSLFKTLKTAEDTGANMIEQATKTAELHMKETEMKADALMSEAKSRAKIIIEDAESRARNIVDDMEDEIRQLEQVFRSLNANKVSMISDLKMLAGDILDKIKRHEEFPSDIRPQIRDAKQLSWEVNEGNIQEKAVKELFASKPSAPAQKTVEERTNSIPEPEIIEEEIDENLTNLDLGDVSDDHDFHEDSMNFDGEEEVHAENQKKNEAEPEEEKQKEKGSFFDQFD